MAGMAIAIIAAAGNRATFIIIHEEPGAAPFKGTSCPKCDGSAKRWSKLEGSGGYIMDINTLGSCKATNSFFPAMAMIGTTVVNNALGSIDWKLKSLQVYDDKYGTQHASRFLEAFPGVEVVIPDKDKKPWDVTLTHVPDALHTSGNWTIDAARVMETQSFSPMNGISQAFTYRPASTPAEIMRAMAVRMGRIHEDVEDTEVQEEAQEEEEEEEEEENTITVSAEAAGDQLLEVSSSDATFRDDLSPPPPPPPTAVEDLDDVPLEDMLNNLPLPFLPLGEALSPLPALDVDDFSLSSPFFPGGNTDVLWTPLSGPPSSKRRRRNSAPASPSILPQQQQQQQQRTFFLPRA